MRIRGPTMTSSTTRTCGKAGTSTRRCGRSGRATPSSASMSSRPCRGRAGTKGGGRLVAARCHTWLFSTLQSRNPLLCSSPLKSSYRGLRSAPRPNGLLPGYFQSYHIVPNRPDFYDSYRITSCLEQGFGGLALMTRDSVSLGTALWLTETGAILFL